MSKKTYKSSYAMSRKMRNLIFVWLVVILAVVAVLDKHFSKTGGKHVVVESEFGWSPDFEKYHDKNFVVVKVVDGDTIDINVPDADKSHTRIRLWGIDTPETAKSPGGEMYFGNEASEFATELVLGKTVTVFLDEGKNTRGKYGRLLAYVQLPDGRYLNEVLLRQGYAYADLRFDHSFYNKYQQLESSARSLKKGLWENVSQEQLPAWLQKRKPQLLKK